ncbi:hypothetical protein [Listeria booriae]|uniref:hypothetical protein n=1 Tax=Listeria booriae TaxID=1552123 RepID=UPI0016254FC4|nr:hypothetical protein [Listeria booriae]MBC1357931.1 hypothetical protein [Listeria booriae]
MQLAKWNRKRQILAFAQAIIQLAISFSNTEKFNINPKLRVEKYNSNTKKWVPVKGLIDDESGLIAGENGKTTYYFKYWFSGIGTYRIYFEFWNSSPRKKASSLTTSTLFIK